MKISILRNTVLIAILFSCAPPLFAQTNLGSAAGQTRPIQLVSNLVDSVELSLVPKWESSGVELRLSVQYSLFQSSASKTSSRTRASGFGSLILYTSEN